MWRCPKCNKENKGNFCVSCGEPKTDVTETLSEYAQYGNQQVREPNNMSGNVANQQGANYNNTPINNQQEKVTHIIERKSNIGLVIICVILALLLVIALCFVGFFVWNNFNSTSKNNEPIVYETTEPVVEEPGEIVIDIDPYDSSAYFSFNDFNYNFVCPYPANFREVDSYSINALKTYESSDGTATMIIRASGNTYGISVDEAVDDFYSAYYDGEVTYEAYGETWYAASLDLGDRLLYRKCFITNGNIYCFDFEFNEFDVDYYSPFIEYIENNFKVF